MLFTSKGIIRLFILAYFVSLCGYAIASAKDNLRKAYPETIQSVSDDELIWRDGTRMSIHDNQPNKTQQEKLDNPALYDQINDTPYITGIPEASDFNPAGDPGRVRYTPFFQKMYGATEEEVQSRLVTIYWMPMYFANLYPLLVTTVNGVDQKLMAISSELENLVLKHPEYLAYLSDPGGTFKWRVIANTTRLSAHSFGMTIDINSSLSDYWQWDLTKEGRSIDEDQPLIYRNQIPWEIIAIFEKYGFISGAKWHHYDSMHFEYRPELIAANEK